MLTVFSALVVGLVLFRFQTRETGRKRWEDLAVLLEAELGEPEREFLDYSPVVPGEILEDLRPSVFHDVRLNIPPLVIEEAARSGLFGAKLTARMLILARDCYVIGDPHGQGLGWWSGWCYRDREHRGDVAYLAPRH